MQGKDSLHRVCGMVGNEHSSRSLIIAWPEHSKCAQVSWRMGLSLMGREGQRGRGGAPGARETWLDPNHLDLHDKLPNLSVLLCHKV